MYVHTYIHIETFTATLSHTLRERDTHTYIHTHTHIQIHTHTNVPYTYTHKHTHSHAPVTIEYAVCDLRSLVTFLLEERSVREDPLPIFWRSSLIFVLTVKNITCVYTEYGYWQVRKKLFENDILIKNK